MLKLELNNLIAENKIKKAIDLLKKQNIEDSDILTGLNAISQSYHSLENEIIIGNVDKGEETLQKNTIGYRLQKLIAQLPGDKPTPTHPRNIPTDYDMPLDIGFLSKRPHNSIPDMANLGKYMPEMARRMKDLGHYSKLDDMVTMSAGINRVIADIFDPFIKTVRDSTHLSHLDDEVGFNEIALSDELMPKTRLFIADLREQPTPESRYKRSLVISALTLSLVRQFDTAKFYVLSDFIADAEPYIWKRALVGLYFALSGREDDLGPFVQAKLKRLCANEDVQKGLEDIEIIVKNKEYLLSDKDNNAFSDINNDPFFKASPHNWFIEFRPEHPSVKTAVKHPEVLDLIQNAPDLPINAFRYAFALNYNQYDAPQKKQIVDKAKAQKITFEKRYPSVQEREKQRENNTFRQFARELYFFYKMYNKDEYEALLEKNISLYHSPLRDVLFSEKCQNRISARLDYLDNKHESAIEKLLKLDNNYQDDLIPALLGFCYKELKDYEKALHYLIIAHTIEPLDTWNLDYIGACHYSNKNFNEALNWHLKAYEIDSNDAWNLNRIGGCHYFKENKDYNEALIWYLKVYDIENNNADNLNQIGACYEFKDNQDYSEALVWYLKAYEIENSNVWNLNRIGDCYYFKENQDYNEALIWFLKVYDIDNNNVWNLNRIGDCYYFKENQDYNEALIWYLKAHEIDSNNVWNLNRIGGCYYFKENKDYNESLIWYLKAHEIDSNDAWNLNQIGDCYFHNENPNYNEALIWHLKAYEIEKDNVKNLNRIGDCYFNNDRNYSEALIWHLKAYEIEKNNTNNLNRIAYCYLYGFKDYEKALNYYLLSEKNQEQPYLSFIISFVYFKLNEKDNFKKYLDKIFTLEPKDATYYGSLGWLNLITNNISFAKEHLNKAFELDEVTYSSMNLAHIHLMESNKEAALELYKRSIVEMKDDEQFFRGMAEDYEHLSPHGITEAAYAEVIATLRQFCAEKAIG